MDDIAQEADGYYARNRANQREFAGDYFQNYLRKHVRPGMRVLEVGCSSGYRLAALASDGVDTYGIDPSPAAIADGAARYPGVHLTVAGAHALPYDDAFFDLVYVPTVFYAIPRDLLLRSVSEIDRVLKDGGTLVIDDFFPETPYKRENRHAPGTYIYKQYYWETFSESYVYRIEEKLPRVIGSDAPDPMLAGGDGACILVRLTKSLEENYPVRPPS